MSEAERGAAERVTVYVQRGGRTWTTDGALGYGTGRPFEVILGFGGGPAWTSWAVDVSVAILGIYCPPSSPAGMGDVRIWRHGEDCVAVALHDGKALAVAHYPADAFCRFVETVVAMYEDPEPLADEVLAAQIEEWITDAT